MYLGYIVYSFFFLVVEEEAAVVLRSPDVFSTFSKNNIYSLANRYHQPAKALCYFLILHFLVSSFFFLFSPHHLFLILLRLLYYFSSILLPRYTRLSCAWVDTGTTQDAIISCPWPQKQLCTMWLAEKCSPLLSLLTLVKCRIQKKRFYLIKIYVFPGLALMSLWCLFGFASVRSGSK